MKSLLICFVSLFALAQPPAPHIANVSRSGKTVVITGEKFGDQGTVLVRFKPAGVGWNPDRADAIVPDAIAIRADQVTWTDEVIVVKLDAATAAKIQALDAGAYRVFTSAGARAMSTTNWAVAPHSGDQSTWEVLLPSKVKP